MTMTDLQAAATRNGLTLLQATFLEMCQEPVGMTVVAKARGCSTAGVTGMADVLESKGFLERIRATTPDRRAILISCTAKGREVLKNIYSESK